MCFHDNMMLCCFMIVFVGREEQVAAITLLVAYLFRQNLSDIMDYFIVNFAEPYITAHFIDPIYPDLKSIRDAGVVCWLFPDISVFHRRV